MLDGRAHTVVGVMPEGLEQYPAMRAEMLARAAARRADATRPVLPRDAGADQAQASRDGRARGPRRDQQAHLPDLAAGLPGRDRALRGDAAARGGHARCRVVPVARVRRGLRRAADRVRQRGEPDADAPRAARPGPRGARGARGLALAARAHASWARTSRWSRSARRSASRSRPCCCVLYAALGPAVPRLAEVEIDAACSRFAGAVAVLGAVRARGAAARARRGRRRGRERARCARREHRTRARSVSAAASSCSSSRSRSRCSSRRACWSTACSACSASIRGSMRSGC